VAFPGFQLNIDRLLNKTITVHKFKIEPSKQKAGTEYLTMEIMYEGERRIVWSGGKALIDAIRQTADEDFPFETTIIKNDRQYQFS
jgi:hypothetical protein